MVIIERMEIMKTTVKILSMMLIMMRVMSFTAYADDTSFGSSAAFEDEVYTLEEMLQYALEDERMAQAEYASIMETFDVTRPFSNIEKAEIQHESAVLGLYEVRGIEVPEFDGSTHVVLPDTLAETYEIGIQAEINNIAMYDKFLEQELEDDVRVVFEALRNGSVSHLEAFQRASEGSFGGANARNGRR